MKYEFSGMSTEQFNPQVKDEFVEFYENLFFKKTPFTVELEDKEVELYLYIEDLDMADYEDTEDYIITIGVIPSFKSLSKKHQQDILSQFSENEQELIKADTMGLVHECYCYGFHIGLRSETVKDLNLVEHKLDSAMATHTAVSGLIGFELDRYYNRIGNTGWDFLEDYCNDGDLISMAMAKMEVKE